MRHSFSMLLFVAALAGCAVDGNGDPYVPTPRLSVPIPKTDSVLWGYGVIGLSSPAIHRGLNYSSSHDGKSITPP